MGQEHLDRLSAVDAAFLHQEGRASHMHIGALALFEGDAPAHQDLLEHVRGRLHLVPRYRQRVAAAPLGLGRQRWIDDPRFNLEYHVRHTALPAPGGREQLLRLAARIFSQRLDRTKPLWELWLVEGVAGAGFAVVSKTHHALVDGVSGVDLMTTLFDLDAQAPRAGPPPPWVPHPRASEAQLAAAAVQDTIGRAAALPLRAAAALARPAAALGEAREAAGALAEVARRGMSPAPPTPLNVRIGPHRRIETVEARLEDLRRIKRALGGTVNDVVLAVSAGAVRSWLHTRGLRTEGVDMRACVPMSTRSPDDAGTLGNRITQVVVPFPVYVGDPVERLRLISEATRDVKESRLAAGAELIAGMQDFAPPTLLAQASRLNFSGRLFNLLVTNVPGPQFPLYLLGRRLRNVFPLAFLAGDRALAVAVMSYDGGVDFGLIADRDAMPDLEDLADGLERSIAEYLELSARRGPARPGCHHGGSTSGQRS